MVQLSPISINKLKLGILVALLALTLKSSVSLTHILSKKNRIRKTSADFHADINKAVVYLQIASIKYTKPQIARLILIYDLHLINIGVKLCRGFSNNEVFFVIYFSFLTNVQQHFCRIIGIRTLLLERYTCLSS